MSLYNALFYTDEIKELLSKRNLVAQMLLFEKTLALAQAENGLIPQKAADCIANCCLVENIDIQNLRKAIPLGGNAAIPLVKQLTQVVKNQDAEAAKFVHFGATSQDVVDTAIVLQIKEFMAWTEQKLSLLETILIETTKKHRKTLMIGRTLLQQAKPITFGLKTAYWLESISRSKKRLDNVKSSVLMLQLAGAVGSGNENISSTIQKSQALRLGLNPSPSWHTQRDSLAEFAAILGILGGSLAKIAKDIVLMMQTEVGEVFEGAAEGKGGSSTMPHKRNPVISTAILANGTRLPNLVATILAAMPQEHERSAGLWHAEWDVLMEIMLLSAGALDKSIDLLQGLEVDAQRMLKNLEQTNGLIYAENVSLALTQKIGKAQAHELIEKACKSAVSENKHLKKVLIDANIDLTQKDLNHLFKPENSIGLSLEIIDDILHHYA